MLPMPPISSLNGRHICIIPNSCPPGTEFPTLGRLFLERWSSYLAAAVPIGLSVLEASGSLSNCHVRVESLVPLEMSSA